MKFLHRKFFYREGSEIKEKETSIGRKRETSVYNKGGVER